MYKLILNPNTKEAQCIKRLTDNAFIPFCPDNTDYQQFLRDVEAGAELIDVEGNVMTQEQVSEFIETLL